MEEGDENLEDRLHVPLVEREALALVVAGTAQPLELIDDRVAVLLAPRPDPAAELLAPEVLLAQALLAQHLLDDVLRGDAGVVRADQPARVLPQHPVVPREDILDGPVERMPHVQTAGDVGRRDDDGVGRPRQVGLGMEEPRAEPALGPARLDGGGLEARGLAQMVVGVLCVGHGASMLIGTSWHGLDDVAPPRAEH